MHTIQLPNLVALSTANGDLAQVDQLFPNTQNIDDCAAVLMNSTQSDYCFIHFTHSGQCFSKLRGPDLLEQCDSLYYPLTRIFETSIEADKVLDVLDISQRAECQPITLHHTMIKHYVGCAIVNEQGEIMGYISLFSTQAHSLTRQQLLVLTMVSAELVAHAHKQTLVAAPLSDPLFDDVIKREMQELFLGLDHELKSPLNAIKNLIIWIIEDLEKGQLETSLKYLRMLENSEQRMRCVLDSLRCYAQINDLNSQIDSVQLAPLVEHCTPLAQEGFSLSVKADDIDVKLPREPLQLVLSYLIANAVQHRDKAHCEVSVTCTVEQEGYLLSVIDNGPGIDPRFSEKIFKPFQTLKPKDELESSGLGLTIVKTVLARYGATIKLHASLEAGCTFNIQWPQH